MSTRILSRDSILTRFGAALFAAAILGFVIATKPLSSIPRGIAIIALVISWAASLLLRRRDVRAHGSAVSAIASVIAAGQTDAGVPYGIACGGFLLVCLASMRAAGMASSSPSASSIQKAEGAQDERKPSQGALLIILATTASITAAFLFTLPPLARKLESRFDSMFGSGNEEATAFSTTMVLGSTRGMLQSNTIVMHIDGPRPEYLRGAVYDRYDGTHWLTTLRGRRRQHVVTKGPAQSSDETTTNITLVRGTPNGEDMRWFLPSGACDLATSPGKIDIDAFGVVRRGRGEDPPTLSFRFPPAACATSQATTIAEPFEDDVFVDDGLSKALGPLTSIWVRGATTDREKLAAIDRELGRFRYSLAVARDKKLDPIVDFVTLHQAGHCEMFASAMVLMARTQGIPARVIGGYHVSEVNPLTGRAVVRDRHAHAWVEAWVEGQWRSYDPTPGSEANRKNAGVLDHIGDFISSGFERIAIAISRLGLLGTAAVLVVFVALLSAARWIGQRLRRRRRRIQSTVLGSPPLPCFESLTDALARVGHERDASEPVESFARRLAKLGAPWSEAVSEALLRYSGLRYGGIGDEDEIVRHVNKAAKNLARNERARE